ncbi:MAG: hypothetical protein IKW56_02990, partial [Methanocorpusculum sp.]|nr:hypothetical protein [Methanocorpusculum sp.]
YPNPRCVTNYYVQNVFKLCGMQDGYLSIPLREEFIMIFHENSTKNNIIIHRQNSSTNWYLLQKKE